MPSDPFDTHSAQQIIKESLAQRQINSVNWPTNENSVPPSHNENRYFYFSEIYF